MSVETILALIVTGAAGLIGILVQVGLSAMKSSARDLKVENSKEHEAIWSHINSSLVPRKEFELHGKHVEDGLLENSRKLDGIEKKLDDHFAWELGSKSGWDGKDRRG